MVVTYEEAQSMGDSIMQQIERYKSIAEYLRHITALSTGSIVLISTFLEKLFPQPQWKCLEVISKPAG
jgi:hypothetical protein